MQPVSPVIPGLDLPEVTFAKYQPDYIPLPAYRAPDGRVLTRWKLTWTERISVFLYGDMWVQQLTFNKPLQPVKLTVNPPLEDVVCPMDEAS